SSQGTLQKGKPNKSPLSKHLYMVAIPAVLEAGATAKLCADLMQPNEALTMTTSLVYKKRTTLFKWTSRKDLHTCAQFQNDEVWNFEVEVQGSMFSSKEVRKVMIRVYQLMTFVQTDKPIYLPGQTGNLELLVKCHPLKPFIFISISCF
uniref:Uncharacterized protein n=1 Tax=Monopterus albus TaxID=43700 RepID=A0A3Q3QX32_MONAL